MPRMSDLKREQFVKRCVAEGIRIINEIAYQASTEKGWYFELNETGVVVRSIKDDTKHQALDFERIARKVMVSLAKHEPLSINLNVDPAVYVSPFDREPRLETKYILIDLNQYLRRYRAQDAQRTLRRMAIAWELSDSSDELEYACLTTIFLDGTTHRRYLSKDALEFLFFTCRMEYAVRNVNKLAIVDEHRAVTVSEKSIDFYVDTLEQIKRELFSSYEMKVLSNDAN